MTTLVVAVTCAALTVNVVLRWPAATTTLLGTTAKIVLLLASATTAFPVGAAEARVTVAVEEGLLPWLKRPLTNTAYTAYDWLYSRVRSSVFCA